MELRWRLLRDIWVRGKRNYPHLPSFVLPPPPDGPGACELERRSPPQFSRFSLDLPLALLFWNTTGVMPFWWNVCCLLTPPLIWCVHFFINHIPDRVKTIEKHTAKKTPKPTNKLANYPMNLNYVNNGQENSVDGENAGKSNHISKKWHHGKQKKRTARESLVITMCTSHTPSVYQHPEMIMSRSVFGNRKIFLLGWMSWPPSPDMAVFVLFGEREKMVCCLFALQKGKYFLSVFLACEKAASFLCWSMKEKIHYCGDMWKRLFY